MYKKADEDMAKNTKIIRIIICMISLFAMVITLLPSNVYAKEDLPHGWKGGSVAVYENSRPIVSSDGDYYWSYGGGGNYPRFMYTIKKRGGDSYPGYCLNKGVINPTSASARARNWTAADIVSSLSIGRRTGLMLSMLYGRQPQSTLRDMERLLGIDANGQGAMKRDWWVATQALVWDFMDGTRRNVPSTTVTVDNVKANSAHYRAIKGRPAARIYRAMLNKMVRHNANISFLSNTRGNSKAPKNPKTIYMDYHKETGEWKAVNKEYAKAMTEEDRLIARQNEDYYVLVDEKKEGSARWNGDIKAITANGEKNKRHTWEKVGNGEYTLTYKHENQQFDEDGNPKLTDATIHGKKVNIVEVVEDLMLVWTMDYGQAIGLGADDPIDLWYKMVPVGTKDEPGEGEVEVPEPDVPAFEFDVEKMDLNPGFDQASEWSHTGMGDAPLDSEITIYMDGEELETIFLDENGYSGGPFWFMPWESIDELEKEVEKVPNPNNDPTTGDPPEGEPAEYERHTYTGQRAITSAETYIPLGRFSEEESGTGDGTHDHGTIVYNAVCSNVPGEEPITYNITYLDEDGNSTALTDPSEVSPDITHTMFGATGENAYVNDNFRGEFHLEKTKDDLNPFTNPEDGVKDFSTNSKWTVQLESGGYEDHPYIRVVPIQPGEYGYDKFEKGYRVVRDNSGTAADPSNPLTLSEFGQLRLVDLPYGTYIVKEIAADNNGYVLESFRVTVSYDGQLIAKEVNDKPKENRIKINKTNAETGKTVRWDADRTAFRIRYMGHEEYGSAESVDGYGQLIPNGSSYNDPDQNYIFYADKNGEIVLPYELEYGIYQIEELVVPEGYYVGQYDNTGTGTIADMGEVKIINHKGQEVTPPKKFLETVQVRDDNGNKVEVFTGDEQTTYNTYTFRVMEQDDHMDGEDYITYYANIDMPNNPAKGKIEITKLGEKLAGWNAGGNGIFSSVWDNGLLPGSKFEIYAAKDIMQSDGVVPIKAFRTADDSAIELEMTSRDHADNDEAKEYSEATLDSGEIIKRVSDKLISDKNMTVTDYMIKALHGATYKESFTVRDDDKKETYKYTVEYKLNYVKGEFNYTDVHIIKETVSDDYVASIEVTDPKAKTGEEELEFTTYTAANGNMIRMNQLEFEKEYEDDPENDIETSGYIGVWSDYNTDDIKATIIVPDDWEQKLDPETGDPMTDPETGDPIMIRPNAPEIPEGWTEVVNAETGEVNTDKYLIEKDGEYKVWVDDGSGNKRWISCTADAKYYLSYKQEYDFTLAQHFNTADGFEFTWDDVIRMTATADHEAETATTIITGHKGSTPAITQSAVYSHETVADENGNPVTTFTGKPNEAAPVYFLTNDGIRTEMLLSGKLTKTTVTVTQDQLVHFGRGASFTGETSKEFEKVWPNVTYNGMDLGWNAEISPDNNYYEYIADDQNYIKVQRHEVSPDNPEVYYTFSIVSNNTDPDAGFKITYPDTTTCVPLVTDGGEGATLRFESCDDTMVYPIGSPVEVITANDNGIAESSPLPLGDYWVREIASVEGHVNAGEWQKFTLEYDGQYTPLVWGTGTYENSAVRVRIDLEKLFETGYKSKEYGYSSGAVFGVYTAEEITGSPNEDTVVGQATLPADSLVGTMTVQNGEAIFDAKLPLGRYYIKEISVPSGYKLNGTKYYFDAIDVLNADQMTFAYRDIGVQSGTVTQDGENGTIIDFDVLYRYTSANVTINGKAYSMDQDVDDGGVKVNVKDGRTNVRVYVAENGSAAIVFENGSSFALNTKDQTYSVLLGGTMPSSLDTGVAGNENFTVTDTGNIKVISYTPKVTKTNWLSEVTAEYVAPKYEEGEEPWNPENILTDEEMQEKHPATDFLFTSAQGTSAIKTSIDYSYEYATLTFPTGTVTGMTVDGETVDITDTLTLQRVTRDAETGEAGEPKTVTAVINFDDGVTFTVTFDATGHLYISASGYVDDDLDTESTITSNDEQVPLADTITIKNTTQKTYARNNTNAGVLNISIKNVKNDRLPEEPDEPVTPDEPVVPPSDKPSMFELTKTDVSTGKVIPDCGIAIYDSNKNEIFRGTTDENGKITFGPLDPGTYYYQEYDAPDGYVLDEGLYKFIVTGNGLIVKAKMTNEPVKTSMFELTKTDVSTGKVIPDCGIAIYDENKNEIFRGRTDENGKVRFGPLEPGTYYYQEYDAPKGYVLDDSLYKFIVEGDGKIIKAEMTNTPKKGSVDFNTDGNADFYGGSGGDGTPKTGDDSNMMIPLLLLLLSAIGAGSIAIYDRRQRRKM